MTREEALVYMELYRLRLKGSVGDLAEDIKAYDIAIEALRAETCEDTISRKHLLSEIDDLMKSPWFNRWKDDGGALHFGYVERKEAVEIVRDLCVKAEPSVTPKPIECEDAIKRESVLNTLDTMDKALDENRTVEAYKELLKECYKELPPVTPKPRTGKWIHQGDKDEWWCDVGKCSVCDIEHIFGLPYCPNCGAKMEGMK